MHFRTTTPGPGRHVLPRRAWKAMANPAGVEVPLAGLLHHARPAYPHGTRSWNAALRSLLTWPADAEIVHTIADELRAGAVLEEPVWVSPGRGHRVRNGMHRIGAHILAGAPTIRVSSADRPAAQIEQMIAVTAALAPLPGVPQTCPLPPGEDPDWSMGGWEFLRSLRAGPVWASSDIVGLRHDRFGELAYYVEHQHRDALLAAMEQRAARHGYALQVHTVNLVRSDDEDIFPDELPATTASAALAG